MSEQNKWKACDCWKQMDDKLREKGFKLDDGLSALSLSDFRVSRLLPLQRLDGKRLRRGDPKSISMSHCPFCGAAFEEPKTGGRDGRD